MAIPELLELLDVHGALVPIDAMGCQKAVAQKIVEQGGDYILSVKGNQPNLLEDIQTAFNEAFETNFENVQADQYETLETRSGVSERRRYTILTDPGNIRSRHDWENLSVIGMCHTGRVVMAKGAVRFTTSSALELPAPRSMAELSGLTGASRITCTGNSM